MVCRKNLCPGTIESQRRATYPRLIFDPDELESWTCDACSTNNLGSSNACYNRACHIPRVVGFLSAVTSVASVLQSSARYSDTELRIKAARHILNQVNFHLPTATAIASFSVGFDEHYLQSIKQFKINVKSVMDDCEITSPEARRLLIASDCDPLWATVTHRSLQVVDDTNAKDVSEPVVLSTTSEDNTNGDIEERECIVCLEPILAGTSCVLLPCKETEICSLCATSWKKQHSSCPKCRVFIDGIVVHSNIHIQLPGKSRLLKWAPHLTA